jgi:hypothetical protein
MNRLLKEIMKFDFIFLPYSGYIVPISKQLHEKGSWETYSRSAGQNFSRTL